jgi:Domain of unknown function (DUF6894)
MAVSMPLIIDNRCNQNLIIAHFRVASASDLSVSLLCRERRSVLLLRALASYHFNIVDGVEVFDSVGVTLPDNEAARRRALELATI